MKPNKIIIIGNGFDLAHGLKSSYTDFMLNYLNSVVLTMHSKGIYKDELLQLQHYYSYSIPKKIQSISEFTRILRDQNNENPALDIDVNVYLTKLLDESANHWIDIEKFYYKELIQIWSRYGSDKANYNTLIGDVEALNQFIVIICKLLKSYLETEQNKLIDLNQNLENLLRNEYDHDTVNAGLVYLNFNYSDVLKRYVPFDPNKDIMHNQIHGSLDQHEDEMIFGYGDITDPVFLEFEKSGNDAFLKHMKHYEYLRSPKYQSLLSRLKANPFEVYILGHSCGMSDRLLLSDIFTHDNCKKIKYYYYQREDGTNDYFEKAYAISRILPLNQKDKLTKLLVPFPDSIPLNNP